MGLRGFFLVLVFAGMEPYFSGVFGHGSYHDVVARLQEHLAATPEDTEIRMKLAEAHVEHGEWRACLDEVARIGALAPGRHKTGSLSGRSLAGLGRLEEAQSVLEAHLSIQPVDPVARVARARIRVKLGRFEAGMEDYREALKSPAPAGLYVEICGVLKGKGKVTEALAVANEGVARCDADPAILVCAVECAGELGETDAAIAYLERLQQVWPRPEPWMQRKAEILAEAGRASEAQKAWHALLEHLLALPNLERSQPLLIEALSASRRALGIEAPAAVVAPPAN